MEELYVCPFCDTEPKKSFQGVNTHIRYVHLKEYKKYKRMWDLGEIEHYPWKEPKKIKNKGNVMVEPASNEPAIKAQDLTKEENHPATVKEIDALSSIELGIKKTKEKLGEITAQLVRLKELERKRSILEGELEALEQAKANIQQVREGNHSGSETGPEQAEKDVLGSLQNV